jgi:Autographiviridae RNA polymerase
MTLPYGVTKAGMVDQIDEKCEELAIMPARDDVFWLRDQIWETIAEELPGAMRTREFIQKIVERLLEPGRESLGISKKTGRERFQFRAPPGAFMKWVSPSGFPVANRYHRSVKSRVYLPFLGQTPTIADEYTDLARRKKAVDSAVANLVHSQDAAHLCRSINRAVAEGITDFMSIHDCYGALAPDVGHFARIRRWEAAELYQEWDALPRLLEANGIIDMELPERDPAFDLTAVANYSTYFDR